MSDEIEGGIMYRRPGLPPRQIAPREFNSLRADARRALRVPPKYAKATLDNLILYGGEDQQKCTAGAVRIARRLVGEYPDWQSTLVAFTGYYGTGKGHLCWALAKAIVEQNAAS